MVLGRLSEFFQNHPSSTNAIFSLILVILEKVAEIDFVCPCVKGYKGKFIFCYLLVPMFLAFVFGLYFQGFECQCSSKKVFLKKFVASLMQSFVWLALFFCDGRYWACYNTELKSEHADSDENPPWEWCSKSRNLTDDQYHAEKEFYDSKFYGFLVLSILSAFALFYKCCKNSSCCQDCGETNPCCSDYGRTCGSAHCRECCGKHPRNCCSAHKNIQCLAHPPEETPSQGGCSSVETSGHAGGNKTQENSGTGEENTELLDSVAKPCDNKSCPCLCHQTCSCDCHKILP